MHQDAAAEYLEVLLDYQFDLLDIKQKWGLNHAEFLFIKAAEVICDHDSLRERTLNSIEQTLQKINERQNLQQRPHDHIPVDFIWFLVHWTKWEEFHGMASRLCKLPDDVWHSNLITRSSNELLKALESDWGDREFYACYSE